MVMVNEDENDGQGSAVVEAGEPFWGNGKVQGKKLEMMARFAIRG